MVCIKSGSSKSGSENSASVHQGVIAVRKRETRCDDLINIYNKG